MSSIFSIDCHVNDCSNAMAIIIIHTYLFHKFAVSSSHLMAVYFGNNSMSADFLYIRNSTTVYLFPIGFLQTLTDWVRRRTFCQSSIFQKFLFFHLIVMNSTYFKYSLCQSSCFIKHYILCL